MRHRLHELLAEIGNDLHMTSDALMGLLEERMAGAGGRLARIVVSDRRGVPRPGPDRRRRPRHRLGILGAVGAGLAYALGGRRRRARIHAVLAEAGVPPAARARIAQSLEEQHHIEQQLSMLEPFQAAFRYWHAFHLPLAVVMVLVLIVHVGVAVAFGYTWIWRS
jgi:hypothetical protein